MGLSAAQLQANLETIRARIAAAAARAGRGVGEVRLIAVTKTVEAETIAALYRAGQVAMGESRVQAVRDKQTALAALLPKTALDALQWHMIGPLQSNKINLAVNLFNTLHAVDSLALGEAVGRRVLSGPARDVRVRAGSVATALSLQDAPAIPRLPVMLEVNVSGEASKRGVTPAEALELAPKLATRPGIQLCGLMTMAPYEAPEALLRKVFGTLRKLRDTLAAGPASECTELSMGMSDDFEMAIEEGATQVRVGRALFA